MLNDEKYMRLAIEEAIKAEQIGEVPIGAVIVDDEGEIIATGSNAPISGHDPCGHAEIVALRKAASILQNYRLKPNLSLYVTLEPCTMCAGAISAARIARVIYAATDKKGGAIKSGVRFFESDTCHHRPQITEGILGDECSNLLKNFFAKRRI